MLPRATVLGTFLRQIGIKIQYVLFCYFPVSVFKSLPIQRLLIVDYFFTFKLRKFCTFSRFLHPKIRSIYRNILLILTNLVYYLWALDVCFKTETDSQTLNLWLQGEKVEKRDSGSLGWTCTHCCIENRYPTRTYSVAQETLLRTVII